MKTFFRAILYSGMVLLFAYCSEDSPATPKITPVIEADRINMGFNDEVKIKLTIDGQPATNYKCDWNSEIGEIISGNGTSEIVWKSPEVVSTGELSVIVDGENLETPTNVILSSVAPFYDDFSGGTNHWFTNYLKLVDSDDGKLHFKGQSGPNVGLMYAKVNAPSLDEYIIKSRFASVSSYFTGGYEYGVYFKTRDTLTIPVSYDGRIMSLKFYSYLFIISNIESTYNFYTLGYTELDGERKWIVIDSDLAGYDDAIITDFNHYHDFSWVVHPDKLIEVKFGQNTVAVSYMFAVLDSQYGTNFDFFPSYIGFRTVYETEIAVEKIAVTEYEFTGAVPNRRQIPNDIIRVYDIDDLGIDSKLLVPEQL